MNSPQVPAITQLLAAWRDGNASALAELTPHVYAELHRVARTQLAGEKPDPILQPTALVNEAFLRLLEWQPEQWKNRAQFFGVSATLMRRILVQFARERNAAKRGGHDFRVSLSGIADLNAQQETDLVALDDALILLEKLDRRQAQIIEIRFFGGLTLEEAAEMMQLSVSTVRRDFRIARAWLRHQLSGGGD